MSISGVGYSNVTYTCIIDNPLGSNNSFRLGLVSIKTELRKMHALIITNLPCFSIGAQKVPINSNFPFILFVEITGDYVRQKPWVINLDQSRADKVDKNVMPDDRSVALSSSLNVGKGHVIAGFRHMLGLWLDWRILKR